MRLKPLSELVYIKVHLFTGRLGTLRHFDPILCQQWRFVQNVSFVFLAYVLLEIGNNICKVVLFSSHFDNS